MEVIFNIKNTVSGFIIYYTEIYHIRSMGIHFFGGIRNLKDLFYYLEIRLHLKVCVQ